MDKQKRKLLNIEKYRKIIWDSTENDLSHYKRDIRPIRWFILFWVGIVSFWGSAQLLLRDYARLPFGGFIIIIGGISSWNPSFPILNPPLPSSLKASALQANDALYTLRFDQAYYPLNVIWVGLMAVQLCLHWFCLSGKLQRRWYGVYFLLQGICVLISSLIWSDTIIALGLYL